MIEHNGKTYQKLGLHIHTTRSDGSRSPEEVLRLFKDAGYDAVALTDHWVYGTAGDFEGMTILSGCEYNVGGSRAEDGVFHIVGIGMERDPALLHPEICSDENYPDSVTRAQAIIDAINDASGIAELAHPAWSLNTPTQISKLHGLFATEIYNTVSDRGQSNRPYSGAVVDMLAVDGHLFDLLAVDDCHYYTDDHCVAATMVHAEKTDRDSLTRALKAGDYFATLAPSLSVEMDANGDVLVKCSPVCRIVFMSNLVWASGRQLFGENMTQALYHPHEGETFVRVEITDNLGRTAWSNPMKL